MREDVKVALVSNRGPVSFLPDDGGFDTKRGAGGLSGALDPVAQSLGDRAVWIAAAISKTDRAAVDAGELKRLREELGYPVKLLDIEPETYSRYYDVISNRMLWFANHCLWDELDIKDFGPQEMEAWEDSYEPVNDLFARTVAESADDDWIVLFQDYHLALAPKYLRSCCPQHTIFHFTHTSFCAEGGLDRLPDPLPRRVIEGMLGADLVGFHVDPWAREFLKCCERLGFEVDRRAGVVKHGDRRSWVRSYPIPIDFEDVRQRGSDDEAQSWAKRFLKDAAGSPLIVRADRAEPSKNVVRGFEAFGRLLDGRPDLAGAKFVACLYPSRQSMVEYRHYIREIEEIVDKISAQHPGSIELFMQDDYDRTLGALSVYDVLLVNSMMDGMNLVSKEGPAVNQRDGVLVLSEGAGSYQELGEHAVQIHDPRDVDATVRALESAIDMPREERAARAESLRKIVASSTPDQWIADQLEDLIAIKEGNPPATPPP